MSDVLHAPQRPQRPQRPGSLFDEDFDVIEPTPEPEVIEPVFSASELAAAREATWHDGHDAGIQEATHSDAAATRQAMEAIARELRADRTAATALAEQAAQSITHLLLESLAAAFPVLCSRYGDAEVCAIARTVLPALTQEPVITVRVNPRTAAALAHELAQLDPDIAEHVQTSQCDSMPPGDVRIAWHNGGAMRDAAALWEQIAAILVPAGLLRTDALSKEATDAS
jgi:flagellar biosynthesis/type III secretory pathway protein FliH